MKTIRIESSMRNKADKQFLFSDKRIKTIKKIITIGIILSFRCYNFYLFSFSSNVS